MRLKVNNIVVKVCLAIAMIGAINWGLIGFFNWNLVDAIFGGGAREITSIASRVVYALVGICALGVCAYYLLRRGALMPGGRRTALGT